MQYETEFRWHIKNPVKHLRLKFLSKQLKTETCELFPQKDSMFEYVLNTPLNLNVNEVLVDEEPFSYIQ